MLAALLGRWSAHLKVRARPCVPGSAERTLEHSLDDLEARLTVSEAWVLHQTELKRRHEQVSAIACENAEWHAKNMAHLAELHRQRARAHRASTPEDDDSGENAETSQPAASRDAPTLNGRQLASARPPHIWEAP
jgi:hypothetical protein